MKSHEDRNAMPVMALRMAAEPMSDAARTEVRQRVMSAIRPQARTSFFLAQSRRIAAAATAATVLLGSGVAYAANGSLPGSTLYPVKRAAENALVAVLPPGSMERSVLAGLAERRAEEAGILARRTDTSQAEMAGALEQLRNSVRSAGGATGLQEQELARILTRVGDVPDWARTAIENAVSTTGAEPGSDQNGFGPLGGSDGTSGGNGMLEGPATDSGSSGDGSGGQDSGSDTSGSGSGTGSAGANGQPQSGQSSGPR